MNGFVTIQGKVIGSNSIRYGERIIECWTSSMQAAVVPRPLDLTPYEGKVIEVSGRFHGNLWEARFEGVIHEEGYQKITGKVIGFNIIKGPDGPVGCYRQGMVEARYLPLNLSEYMGRTVVCRARPGC